MSPPAVLQAVDRSAATSALESGNAPPLGQRPALRVTCIYPYFDPQLHELAMVWQELAQRGEVDCRVLAGSADALKGSHQTASEVDLEGLKIRRGSRSIMAEMPADDLTAWAMGHSPQLLVCSEATLYLGQALHAASGVPMVIYAENWFNHRVLGRRHYLGFPPLQRPAHWLRNRLRSRDAACVIVSCPVEGRRIPADDTQFAYVPWPHPSPSDAIERRKPYREHVHDEVLCIGSMARWKGVHQLQRYLHVLLDRSPDIKVRVVGPAVDAAASAFLKSMARWEGRYTYVPHLPRSEALAAISSALCVFTPSALFGWGVIGDAWNAGTPVVGVDEFYELSDQHNSLIARSPEQLVDHVTRLRGDPVLWQRLVDNGWQRVKERHSTGYVADELLKVVRRVAATTA